MQKKQRNFNPVVIMSCLSYCSLMIGIVGQLLYKTDTTKWMAIGGIIALTICAIITFMQKCELTADKWLVKTCKIIAITVGCITIYILLVAFACGFLDAINRLWTWDSSSQSIFYLTEIKLSYSFLFFPIVQMLQQKIEIKTLSNPTLKIQKILNFYQPLLL